MNTLKKASLVALAAVTLFGLVGCVTADDLNSVNPSLPPEQTTNPEENGFVLPEDDPLAIPDSIPGVKPGTVQSLSPATSEEAQKYCFDAKAVHSSEATSLIISDTARTVFRCYADESGDHIFQISDPAVVSELLAAYATQNADAVEGQACTQDIADPQILWVNSPTVESTEVIYAPVDSCGKPSALASEALTKALASATEL